ncbi:MAG TPA: thioredoxin domain-containing protein [Candidatus Hydrogenedentes bacterium]|nr:thioredoxin domain-containing protein [Candidatus Hydrogenedentota bacterium]
MDSSNSGPRLNRLAGAASPYLIQHASNPVDWYPWGKEALERAWREDKPVFLSVGYAACHWCHVMERESFGNPRIAALLNESFVSVKVDREERPDLDNLYMTAVAAMTGSGGWPLSVFLTPDLKPFYGGTYFPPRDTRGHPGFGRVLEAIAGLWRDNRAGVEESAEKLTENLRVMLAPKPARIEPPAADRVADAALAHLSATFDSAHGGWGGAPKFPNVNALRFLLRRAADTGDRNAGNMALLTLDRMARGGIHDPLGGGFHRYAVDEEWRLPHFEKMLYDNALLAAAHTEAFQFTGDARRAEVARDTLRYVLRDMQGPEGGYYASEDADSGGEEGAFYLWTHAEIGDILAPDEAALFRAAYDVRPEGNFPSWEAAHEGKNVLFRAVTEGELACKTGISVDALRARLAASREALFAARERRVRSGRDEKCVASWNGLMVSALARAGAALDEPDFIASAERAVGFLFSEMVLDGELRRTWFRGRCSGPGGLEDYAAVGLGCIDLYEATLNREHLDRAAFLAHGLVERFHDAAAPGFFDIPVETTDALVRTKTFQDNVEPSGNTLAALLLERLSRHTGDQASHRIAEATLNAGLALVDRVPHAGLGLLCAAAFSGAPPLEITFVPDPEGMPPEAALRAVHRVFLPALTLKMDGTGSPPEGVAVQICRHSTCLPLLRGVEKLEEELRAAAPRWTPDQNL